MDQFYKINSKDATYRIVDNEVVILNLKTGDYYSIDEVGSLAWKLLEKGASRKGIIEKIVKVYGIDKKIASRDVSVLLRDLVSEKLIFKR